MTRAKRRNESESQEQGDEKMQVGKTTRKYGFRRDRLGFLAIHAIALVAAKSYNWNRQISSI